MNFVHHNVRQSVNGGGAFIEHVPKDLGGHDNHRRIPVDHTVAGQQANVVVAVSFAQVAVLLVAERLDRGCVESAGATGEGEMDRELADNGFAATGRGCDQNAMPLLKKLACLHLEGVEPKFVAALESGKLSLRSGIAALSLRESFGRRLGLFLPIIHT